MIADTWLLLQLRWQLTWNGWRHRRLSRKLLYLLGLGFMAFMLAPFSASIGYGSAALVEFMGGSAVEHLMPGLILTAATVLLLLSAFGIALPLFFSSDLDLLMAAPVDRRGAGRQTAGGRSLVLRPARRDGPAGDGAVWLAPALPVLVLPADGVRVDRRPLLTAGIGALAVMLVARFAPARRVRESWVLWRPSLACRAACWGRVRACGSTAWSRWKRTPGSAGQRRTPGQPAHPHLHRGPRPGVGRAWCGGQWAAGDAAVSGPHLRFFALCVWLADRLYASGWTRMQSAGSARRDRKRGARGGFLATAPASLTIPLKDWRIIPRDLRNFAQLLAPLIIIPIVYLNIVNGPRNRSGEDVLLNYLNRLDIGSIPITLTEIGIAGSILFIAALVFTRIALTGISMEGRSGGCSRPRPSARGRSCAASSSRPTCRSPSST
ncbi:MAG: hypothetical protein HZY76_22630 [Anaerolineae bacterium]|nr:MAG: hypothetical protein HZY76_22630 [Anaerolineae bacterium]